MPNFPEQDIPALFAPIAPYLVKSISMMVFVSPWQKQEKWQFLFFRRLAIYAGSLTNGTIYLFRDCYMRLLAMIPDFRKMNERIADLLKLDAGIRDMFSQAEQLWDAAAGLCADRKRRQAAFRLQDIPVEELKTAKAGIRVSYLTEAGFNHLYDLWKASDQQLCILPGIGEKQVAAIRAVTEEFLKQLSAWEQIRLPQEREDLSEKDFVLALARVRLVRQVCRDARVPCRVHHERLEAMVQRIRIRGRLRWLFSFPSLRKETLEAYRELEEYCAGQEFAHVQRLYALYLDAVRIDADRAFLDYERNSAAYYALLEKLGGSRVDDQPVYGSVDAQLADQISRQELCLDGFKGELRLYQYFGVQYVIHQKKVLLGDEMGLGKTIQAIAVMVHLSNMALAGNAFRVVRFLVVCPASVMVNWCREIARFCDIPVWLLHGKGMDEGFSEWKASGGAAVTNYESMRRIAPRIDEHLRMDLLVIDEAHFIKNPDAMRTKLIRRLDDEAGHILLMTGTPLENRVEEMCELIQFIRPELTDKVREYAGLRQSEEFRNLLSPVYLRRRVDEVLTELPDLIEKEEWCDLTASDLQAYVEAVTSGNLMAMRRVSFLQEDMGGSSKAQRLLELCREAGEDQKRIVVFSYFRETLDKAAEVLKEYVIGEITGSTDVHARQEMIDRFSQSLGGSVLLCQVQAGGFGLNIQAAAVVIFCEPQIKPSLERQAIARVFRMGQIHSVMVFHLLNEDTVDEEIQKILTGKEQDFLLFADESAMAQAVAHLEDREWIRQVVEEQRRKYLPAVISQDFCSDDRRKNS